MVRRRRQSLTEEERRLQHLLAPETSLEEAWYLIHVEARRGRAAASTVDALVYQLRRGGTELGDPNARRRLAELSEQQMHEVSVRLQKFAPHVARPWTPDEVEVFVELWSALHG
jgi:transposase